MKAENQKMACLCEDRVEPEGSKEVRSIVSRESMENGGAEGLLTKVLDRENLNKPESFLHRALTDKYLVSIGYASIAERYEALQLKLFNRHVPNGTHGGVRGRG